METAATVRTTVIRVADQDELFFWLTRFFATVDPQFYLPERPNWTGDPGRIALPEWLVESHLAWINLGPTLIYAAWQWPIQQAPILPENQAALRILIAESLLAARTYASISVTDDSIRIGTPRVLDHAGWEELASIVEQAGAVAKRASVERAWRWLEADIIEDQEGVGMSLPFCDTMTVQAYDLAA
jgi:hypothetical protein